jgi:hypothetical protein
VGSDIVAEKVKVWKQSLEILSNEVVLNPASFLFLQFKKVVMHYRFSVISKVVGMPHSNITTKGIAVIKYRGVDWVPSLWSVAIIPRFRHTVHMGTVSTFSCTPYLSLELWNGVEFIILPLNGPSA